MIGLSMPNRKPQRSRVREAQAALLVAFLLAGWLAARAAGDVLTPHHVARLRTVSAVAIAPDAGHVAYLLSVPRQPLVDEDGPAWTELHVIGPDGVSRPYITGKVNLSRIAWTPDGKAISFLAKRGGDRAPSLYRIAVEGGEAEKVLEHAPGLARYAWSPDGKRVAFLAAEPISEARRAVRDKGFNQEIFEEDAAFTRVWIAAPGTGSAPRKLDLAGSATDLSWSPAGGQLAVALAPTPLVDDEYMRLRLHVVDVETGRSVATVENPGKLGEWAWSPDGRYLAMISAADLNDPMEGRLMVVAAAPGAGAPRDLLPGYLGHVTAIAWQNAETVMFLGEEGVGTTFGKVNRDGTGRSTIVAAGGAVLTALSLSRDGMQGAFIGQAASHPAEVFRMRHGAAAPQRVTHSNPWLAGLRLAPQEVVRYKARDGLELEGILIRPLDERPGTRYPLILTVHGGPEAHYRNAWLTTYSAPGQVAAARGFAVFYPNYRGSTGRGVKFSKLGQGDAAGREFDDLVDGVDHLVRAGGVDRAKVGITGGSYGGYASAWGATYYSERFAAAVMFVGISNKISKVGTTDIANEEYYVHARHRPWDAWDLFLKRSPIYHAGKGRTPTLILGGTDDPRVHPSQSLEMYRHLKLHGRAPVRLVRYPGEKHGNARAASRLDYSLRLLQWMEHYLKGPGGAPPPAEIEYAEPK